MAMIEKDEDELQSNSIFHFPFAGRLNQDPPAKSVPLDDDVPGHTIHSFVNFYETRDNPPPTHPYSVNTIHSFVNFYETRDHPPPTHPYSVNTNLGLSLEELRKLPCLDYDGEFNRTSNKDCVVCLEGLKEGERCRILPRCKHVFPANCVDAWLIKVAACSLCRAAVESGLRLGG
ncbi:hypothetical protein NE237_021439 [Protea cynaroides]|uniref:RING-type domain-containing protein n=1 Tax=Protea cynaroides TaxID=273540 RepID=A0A9Q0H938_9MAGN|nr:hypothetical protein NE237_021439 [Protea cynaroides]